MFHFFFSRLRSLRWILPILIACLVAVFELGPARWIENAFGPQAHVMARFLVYGTVGPLLTFFLLDFINRWMEERQTSELQAQVLAQIQEQSSQIRRLSDEALQTLFATSILVGQLKASLPKERTEEAAYLAEIEDSIEKNIQELRGRLLAVPKPQAPQAASAARSKRQEAEPQRSFHGS